LTENYESPEERKSSFTPFLIAAGVALLFFGFVVSFPLAMAGLAVLALTLLKVFKDGTEEKFSSVNEADEEKWPVEAFSKEKLGTWIFLMSEILIFGSLIVAYIYVRIDSTSWIVSSQVHDVMLGMSNTIILLTSGLAMTLALYSIKVGNAKGLKIGLAAAFILGLTFLIVKLGFEWPALIGKGFTLTSGLPGSTYFVLTGLHAGHVAAGLFAIGYLMVRAFNGGFTSTKYTAVESVALYWAFVDIVWLILFPLLYLI